MTFAAQHQMHWVNLGLNYGNNRSVTNEDILNRDAYTLGMAAQADMDQGGDVAPPASDCGRPSGWVAASPKSPRSLWLAAPPWGASRGRRPGGSENQDPERRGIVEAGAVIAA